MGNSQTGQVLKYDSDDDQDMAEINISMLKSMTDQSFVMKNNTSEMPAPINTLRNGDTNSSLSYDSSNFSNKKEMVRFLSRILDRNKPLFVFNTRLNRDDLDSGYGTPSFSVITLIHEN